GAQHSASLYVGDLHPEISEANLYEIFQALGPVQSIRVCRDVVTRRSLGYSYINFHNVVDAERALETMNYYSSQLTKNKPLRMMWMIRDPSQRRTGAGNIFVKSLDKSIRNKSLYDTFSQFGTILSCKVATDDNGESLGHGFVHFETPEAAQLAIEKVNGKLLAGRKVYVGKFLNKREREAAGQVNKIFTNVFIKNLDDSICDEEKLRELFAEFGDITSIHVAQDEVAKPKGFAFVNFASPEMAKRAVDGMNGKEVAGKTLVLNAAQKKSVREAELRNKHEIIRNERMQKYQGINLYIKNLSDDIDDDRLRTEFSPYGTITSCKIMRDDKGFSRGFGFVCYTTPDEATKAVTELNGRMVGQKPIYVALAQRKDVRRAQLEAQRQMNLRMPGAVPAGAMYAQPSPYMYQQPMPNMGSVNQAVPGRNGPYMHPPYMAQVGRGAAPAGRGGPAAGMQYIAAMGRGQPGMAPGMNPANMQMFGLAPQRQPRQNRQRGGHMGPNAAMVAGRGNPAAGRGRGGPNQGPPGQQFKYTTNARNAAIAAPNGQPQVAAQVPNGQAIPQVATPDAAAAAAQPLTLEMLANATSGQQKQMLGERLYPQIAELQPTLSGKITGMLLHMENTEILHLLESPEALAERVEEAVTVLREHAAASGDQPQGQTQAV
ncbi:Polyadenylate-binding protein, partial [Chondrus crispus]